MTQEQYKEGRAAIEKLAEALTARFSAEYAELSYKHEVEWSTREAVAAFKQLVESWWELKESVK